MMKYFFFGAFLSLLMISCSTPDRKPQILNVSKKVIIAGKVSNAIPSDSTIRFSINRVGFDQEAIEVVLDSIGKFHFEFKTFVPLDGWLSYQTNFLVAAHPGDSIFVEFDATSEDRSKTLETIKFYGDGVILNQQISEFEKRYFQSSLFSEEIGMLREKAVNEYEPVQFKTFTDSLRVEGQKLVDDFVKEISPSEEVKIWAKTWIDYDYYLALNFYADSHRKALMKKQSEWDVPLSYYDYFLEQYPVSRSLIAAHSLSRYSGFYTYRYIRENMKHALKDFQVSEIKTDDKEVPFDVQDSVSIQLIVSKTKDPLLKEISLTYFLHRLLAESEINTYEKNLKLIDEQITQPFLKLPLLKEYNQLRTKLDSSTLNNEVQQNEAKNNIQTVVEDIISKNKGKVIYIDIWATWCGPCREEFPYSKKLQEKFSNEVIFAFMCIESGEQAYRNTVKKFQLTGEHHFLNAEESKKLSDKYITQGIPHYMLINKKGEIAFQGATIKPSEDATASKIKSLL